MIPENSDKEWERETGGASHPVGGCRESCWELGKGCGTAPPGDPTCGPRELGAQFRADPKGSGGPTFPGRDTALTVGSQASEAQKDTGHKLWAATLFHWDHRG